MQPRIPQGLLQQLSRILKRDPKRTGLLLGLVGISIVLWSRLLLNGPASATASLMRRPVAPITDTTLQSVRAVTDNPVIDWLSQPKRLPQRNLFAMKLDGYARAGDPSALNGDEDGSYDRFPEQQIAPQGPQNQPEQLKIQTTMTASTPGASRLVELHVNDASLLDVLRMLSQQSRENIVASKSVTGNVSANLYNVTVREALDAIVQSNGYVYREKGNCIYIYTPSELAEIDKASRVLGTEVFHLNYTPAANAASLIKPALSPGAQVATTADGQSGTDATKSDPDASAHSSHEMLVVTDYTDNLERVKKILQEVDHRPRQGRAEAGIGAEALRIGMRKGLLFFGRDQLAVAEYENAQAELRKPNPDRNLALWHLDAATNLNPTFAEAIELKERVSGDRVTDADRSMLRSFVSDSMLSSIGEMPTPQGQQEKR